MADINEKVETLAKTLDEQFNLIAKGNVRENLHTLKALGIQGQKLEEDIAQEFDIPVTEPLETLQRILAVAETQKLPAAGELKQVLEFFAKMKPALPENSCPTLDGVETAVRNTKKNQPQP